MAQYYQGRFNQTRAARQSAPRAARAASVVFSKLAKATSYSDPALAENWPSIVGPQAAAICRPGRLLGNGPGRTLEVVVRDGGGATSAQMQVDAMLIAINRYLGPNAVNRISIRQNAHSSPAGGMTDDDSNSPLGAALSAFRTAVSTQKASK